MTRRLGDQMVRWPDDQMAGWPEDRMARRPDGQKSGWPEDHMATPLTSSLLPNNQSTTRFIFVIAKRRDMILVGLFPVYSVHS